MSSLVPIQEEIGQYLPVVNIAVLERDLLSPLWTSHAERIPILFRIARRVLPTPASSTDVEKMFSVCGMICTSNRASLSPDHFNVLTLNLWLKEKYGYRNVRADKSVDSCKSELCNHLCPSSRDDSTI
jgi:hypothetical protein